MITDERWIMAQQSVLGSVLIDSACAGKLVFEIGTDDFTGVYQSIYSAIRDLYTTGKAVDPVTVLDKIGGGAEMRNLFRELMEITPTAANIGEYIRICRECSRMHRYKEIGLALQDIESASEAEYLLDHGGSVEGFLQPLQQKARVHSLVPASADEPAEGGIW